MKKKKTILGLAILILLVCLGLWAFWRGPDPQVKKLQEMRKEMFGEGKQPTSEQRTEFHKERQKLTPDQHRQFREPMREESAQRMNQRLEEYFSLPPEKRKDYLDKMIKEGEEKRNEREKRRQDREQNPDAHGGQGGEGHGGGGGGRGTGMGGGGGGVGGGGGGGGGGMGMGRGGGGGHAGGQTPTPEQRSERQNERLDSMTPDQRAKLNVLREDLRKRRVELGLPANPGPGHGSR